MVFSNLSYTEKEAFFGLLDECVLQVAYVDRAGRRLMLRWNPCRYFASRPDVFGSAAASNSASNVNPAAAKAAASAIHNAFSNHLNAPSENNSEPAWRRQINSSSSGSSVSQYVV